MSIQAKTGFLMDISDKFTGSSPSRSSDSNNFLLIHILRDWLHGVFHEATRGRKERPDCSPGSGCNLLSAIGNSLPKISRPFQGPDIRYARQPRFDRLP